MRRVVLALMLLSVISNPASAADPSASKVDVQKAVKHYFDAANSGDVTAVLEMYSRRPEVSSIGDGDITRGWEAIRTDTEQMVGKEGSYKFSLGVVDVVPLGDTYALAYSSGTFTFATAEGGVAQIAMAFSFVLEKSASGWKILHDHASSKASEAPAPAKKGKR